MRCTVHASENSVKETAEAMFVHRNTINYKINKIEEMLNCDLSELDTRLLYYAPDSTVKLHNNLSGSAYHIQPISGLFPHNTHLSHLHFQYPSVMYKFLGRIVSLLWKLWKMEKRFPKKNCSVI